jgi:hypothetical protein
MSFPGKINIVDGNGKIFSDLIPDGVKGKSAYDIYVVTQTAAHGSVLSESAWLASLRGSDGVTPRKGIEYNDGVAPIKGVDYFDGINGTTPVKGVDYFDGITPDTSNFVQKVTGKVLSTNDLTDILKGYYDTAYSHSQAAHAPSDANNYTHPATHSASIITQDISNRFVTDTEKSTWNGKGSSNLALGDLAANAYPGDKGKTAYDHSQATHAPAEATVGADWNTNISNKPTIPAAQIQSDWNAGSGMGQILNKPTIPAALSSLTDDATHRLVTDAEKTTWNAASGGGLGTMINVQALTSSPVDSQTIYFGMLPKAPTTTANISKIYIRKTCTLKIAEIYCYSGTAGTAESWSLYVRKNNTTDTLIATLAVSASERVFSNTALNISLVAGDYLEIKGVQPLWATNPLTCIYSGYLYFE